MSAGACVFCSGLTPPRVTVVGTGLFREGPLCAEHRPAGVPRPDPAATVAGLRERAERLRVEAQRRRAEERAGRR